MTEKKQRRQVEDSFMKLNVVEAPSVRSRILDEDSWTNENTNDSKYVENDKGSSEDEVPMQKQSIKICSKEISINDIFSLEARWLTRYRSFDS